MRSMSVREVTRILRRHGYRKIRHRGGHRQYKRGKHLVTVAGANPSKPAYLSVIRLAERLESHR